MPRAGCHFRRVGRQPINGVLYWDFISKPPLKPSAAGLILEISRRRRMRGGDASAFLQPSASRKLGDPVVSPRGTGCAPRGRREPPGGWSAG